MTDHLDDLLARTDPGRSRTHGTADLIDRMSAAAADDVRSERARRPWWRRPRFILPVAVMAAAATTGAAIAIPLSQLLVGGTAVDYDVTIPIRYTTHTGVQIDCRYGIYIGDPATRSPADDALAAYLDEQDWTGIGQEIYDEAMADPFVPGPDDDLEVDTQALRDSFSFQKATGIIYDRIPADLMAGTTTGSASDCDGRLR